MTATNNNNNNNILPDTLSRGNDYKLSENCHEDKLDKIFGTFTLCLDEDDQCSVSVFDEDDDASFLGEDDDDDDADISTGSCDEEEDIHDDISTSTHTEMDTNIMDPKNQVVSSSSATTTTTRIVQTEGREWKPLMVMAGRPVRERRRGGRRPVRKPSTVAE